MKIRHVAQKTTGRCCGPGSEIESPGSASGPGLSSGGLYTFKEMRAYVRLRSQRYYGENANVSDLRHTGSRK